MNNEIVDRAEYTRYNFSITDDSLVCLDMITGRGCSIENERIELNDLDASKVLMHLTNIQNIIATNPIVSGTIMFPKTTPNLNICELDYDSFEITYSKGMATYNQGEFRKSRKFDVKDIQNLLLNSFDNIRLLQDKGSGVGEYIVLDSVNRMMIIRNPAQDLKIFCSLDHPGSTNNLIVGCIVNGRPYKFLALLSDKLRGTIDLVVDGNVFVGSIPFTSNVLKACRQLPGFDADVVRKKIN